ncbi:related to 54S ribosomal protein L40, mitochondrial [Saccharomycodes ludwigii]|uniref:Related to 54S ribosomal protein L40, mitochondrial n=1 Tax=Saccharomycodes ludwigii TaxID=36035 RepID=A0A376B105_9ASCO|nr:hypothetical protein SCDLUD_002191 [Saccharomycodes ludwigii]KAH3902371.1 hypothetical protein SCDLUD_002191 [Saccharomycodes ludwigii]SSD58311.1 related to 54S ribosomal protein L40, mitochondrial [Saccharomycodes ludwigii]
MSYSHLSNTGSRFTKEISKQLLPRYHKYLLKSVPDFLRPRLPLATKENQYKNERDWVFMPGDRVVVTDGDCRGNVCVVVRHNKDTNSYILNENGPTIEAAVPKELWVDGQKSHVVNFPKAVLKSSLKLLADIEDDKTGKTKTVAIQNVVFRGSYFDKNYNKIMPIRCVSGQEDLIIPWPKPEEHEDGPLATSQSICREQTFWVESIVKAPIPKAALPSIRNEKSKYARKNEKLSTADIKRLVAPKMPLTDTKMHFIAERKELEETVYKKRVLTEEAKEKIGEKVFEHLSKEML